MSLRSLLLRALVSLRRAQTHHLAVRARQCQVANRLAVLRALVSLRRAVRRRRRRAPTQHLAVRARQCQVVNRLLLTQILRLNLLLFRLIFLLIFQP